MGYFLLGITLITAAILILFSLPQASVTQVTRLLRGIALICAALFGLFGLLTGKLLWAIVGLGGALVIYLMGANLPWNANKPEKGSSDVQTPWLHLRLDHSTGGITGDVLQGRFSGARIENLDRDDLMFLLGECARDDGQSARLIEAYLDRMWPEWRNIAGGGSAGGSGRMDREEALSVLGLDESASDDDVRAAHREMMRRHHPDRGGSDWLAAKLNQAKEVLLGE